MTARVKRTSADILADQVFGVPAPDEQPRRRVTRLNNGPTRPPRAERKKLDSADVLSTMITEGRDPR